MAAARDTTDEARRNDCGCHGPPAVLCAVCGIAGAVRAHRLCAVLAPLPRALGLLRVLRPGVHRSVAEAPGAATPAAAAARPAAARGCFHRRIAHIVRERRASAPASRARCRARCPWICRLRRLRRLRSALRAPPLSRLRTIRILNGSASSALCARQKHRRIMKHNRFTGFALVRDRWGRATCS